jgi:hypothetical protein
MRETLWRWHFSVTAASSCVRPGRGTNWRIWSPASHPRIVIRKGWRLRLVETFDPQTGREQAGRRPALVLSPKLYNAKSSLALVCPITNQAKGYPFEVLVPAGHGITGVILTDHVKSVDW